MNNRINKVVASASVMGAGFMPLFAQADFVADSKAALELKNYYFNRDYRESSGQNKRAEWAQGFILKIESGFTDGTVGFGLDAVGMLGIKLDSSPDNSGTGLLARSSMAEPGSPATPAAPMTTTQNWASPARRVWPKASCAWVTWCLTCRRCNRT